MPVPRQSGHADERRLDTAARMNSLLFGIASRSAASSGSTLKATICFAGRGLRGTAGSRSRRRTMDAVKHMYNPSVADVSRAARLSGHLEDLSHALHELVHLEGLH